METNAERYARTCQNLEVKISRIIGELTEVLERVQINRRRMSDHGDAGKTTCLFVGDLSASFARLQVTMARHDLLQELAHEDYDGGQAHE
jgi:hypothetical protein